MTTDFPIIFRYTRRQAIADGVLVDLMQSETVGAVREAGFRFPIAVTAEVWNECIDLTPAAEEAGNDLQGRLWDVLYMLRHAIKTATQDGSIITYQLYVVTDRIQPSLVTLKAICGPGDDAEPVLTIMFPWQD